MASKRAQHTASVRAFARHLLKVEEQLASLPPIAGLASLQPIVDQVRRAASKIDPSVLDAISRIISSRPKPGHLLSYPELIDAEADRLGLPHGGYHKLVLCRVLLICLIMERRELLDRPVGKVRLKPGRPARGGARQK